ncbi:NADH dehydrogenase [ubiquinone] 1 beta subcomplex subunit 3 [Agrilus planipennis]|uniref:NADH dehydrogenase [ubiquinone] 1 beta subcomplex subunit 3 n=1 Tax=Agrilus planipennis TaxID=224129 RepID=A0A1W4WIC6_AGRPL|nr:NADH dehydrogenase [ubiquinone] 1 beta subcomplex subunit 3 [Agrilus planipennis]
MQIGKDLVLFKILKRNMAKVPDYTIYKIDEIPELKKVRDKLKKEGLCNPWLRNEAWRFNRKYFLTQRQRTFKLFARGFPLGAALTALTLGIEMMIGDEHGGHGDHEEDPCKNLETHEDHGGHEKKVEEPSKK